MRRPASLVFMSSAAARRRTSRPASQRHDQHWGHLDLDRAHRLELRVALPGIQAPRLRRRPRRRQRAQDRADLRLDDAGNPTQVTALGRRSSTRTMSSPSSDRHGLRHRPTRITCIPMFGYVVTQTGSGRRPLRRRGSFQHDAAVTSRGPTWPTRSSRPVVGVLLRQHRLPRTRLVHRGGFVSVMPHSRSATWTRASGRRRQRYPDAERTEGGGQPNSSSQPHGRHRVHQPGPWCGVLRGPGQAAAAER